MAFQGSGPRADLVLDANSAKTVNFLWEDENGTSIDFTGSTFKLQVKARDASDDPTGSVLLTLTTGSGIAGTLASGQMNVTFPAGGLAAGEYVYTVLRLSGGNPVEPMLWGHIHVNSGVTS